MNRVTLIANLVRDPEMGQTTSGMATCKFTVACNNGKDKDGNERPADFITCKAFDKRAQAIGKFFKKGSPICVTGAFKTDVYDSKKHEGEKVYSSYVLVSDFEFIGKKSDGGTQAAPAPVAETTPVASEETSNEDIPF